jgi:hypothetical protein
VLRCHVNPHNDPLENLIGAMIIGGPLVADLVATSAAGSVINPAIYQQLEKQLVRAGAASVLKALRSAERTLQEHIDKVSGLQYSSQVERTIRNVRSQIETLVKFIRDKEL